MIDLYCERVGPGFWAEPLNVSSNVAYVLAAWAVWRPAAGGSPRTFVGLFGALLVAIAAGSTLFHVLATPWSRTLDELPIAAFQLVFLWIYGRRVLRLTPTAVAVGLAALLLVVLAARQFPAVLNGSLAYVPAWLVAVGIAGHEGRVHREGALAPVVATTLFGGGIAFRSIDTAVCVAWPHGTHFIWHALTAAALYLFVQTLQATVSRLINQPARTT